ncbi:MAG: hypothetical protein ACMUIA_11060, partial [bacterium]
PFPCSLLSPLPARMNLPRPTLRSAAATITIIFDPAVSIVNVSAVPLAATAPAVPTLAPTIAAPALAPTALTLLPALLAAPTAATQAFSYNPTATPTLKRLSSTGILGGLTSLLPLLI